MPNGKEVEQEIIYEFEPRFCTKCRKIGHVMEKCDTREGNRRQNNNTRRVYPRPRLPRETGIEPARTVVDARSLNLRTGARRIEMDDEVYGTGINGADGGVVMTDVERALGAVGGVNGVATVMVDRGANGADVAVITAEGKANGAGPVEEEGGVEEVANGDAVCRAVEEKRNRATASAPLERGLLGDLIGDKEQRPAQGVQVLLEDVSVRLRVEDMGNEVRLCTGRAEGAEDQRMMGGPQRVQDGDATENRVGGNKGAHVGQIAEQPLDVVDWLRDCWKVLEGNEGLRVAADEGMPQKYNFFAEMADKKELVELAAEEKIRATNNRGKHKKDSGMRGKERAKGLAVSSN